MSGENGEVNEACNRARAKYGLTPGNGANLLI